MLELKCIAYKVPLYELPKAAQGVPMEELEKITQPTIFIPPYSEENPFIPKLGKFAQAKRKAQLDRLRNQK